MSPNQKLRDTFDVILGGERTTQDLKPASVKTATSPQESDSGLRATSIPSGEVDRFVSLAEGGFFYPNFVSDYMMKDLSLGEQSVFNRLLRLTQGLDRLSGKLKIKDVADACGITPDFAARSIQSLQEKGLMRVIRHNPFSRSIRYRLDVLKQWQGKLLLCAICHGTIGPEDERVRIPVARSGQSIQEVLAHAGCLQGEPEQQPGLGVTQK